jgi:hypothetical protein
LTTWAPASTARTIPAATVARSPDPLESSTFTGRIEHAQHTPATPSRLFVLAAITPATPVP